MPVCIALNLVCFGIEPDVLQRAEFCLYLTVQVDEGNHFLLGRRGRSGGLKVGGAFPSVVHGREDAHNVVCRRCNLRVEFEIEFST